VANGHLIQEKDRAAFLGRDLLLKNKEQGLKTRFMKRANDTRKYNISFGLDSF
jgi:hypothetical protein